MRLSLVLSLSLLAACSGDDDDDACFAAGTPITTARGEVAIESLRAGDPVLSRDRESGAIVTAIVTQVRRHPDRAYRVLGRTGGDSR